MPSREEVANFGIRLDVFLKNAGILKRRSLAQRFCEAGAVSVNGHPAKSGKVIHAGDRIQIESWNRRLLVVVRSIQKRKTRQAETPYEVLQDDRKSPEEIF